MLRRTIRTCVVLTIALTTGATTTGAAGSQPDVIAQRGTVQLTAAEIRAALALNDPAIRDKIVATPKALAEYVRERVLRQAILAEARGSGWDQRADVEARANDARDNVIVQSYIGAHAPLDPNFPSQAELASAYEANKDRLVVPKQYHVAQIAVPVAPDAPKDTVEEARRKASDLRQQATRPKANFMAIATRNAQSRGAGDRGAELGWLRDDQLQPAVRAVIGAMAENAVSEPVRSGDAWHVFKLLGTKAPSAMSPEQARDTLVLAMRQAKVQQASRAYVEDLLRKEPVQMDEADLVQRVQIGR
jgi:hypothetical protein